MKLFFDGGCKPNPGKMESAVVIAGDNRGCFHQRLGYGTNNEAEWLAMLWAMEIAIQRKVDKVVLLGDSTLVVKQAQGLWRINKAHLKPFYAEFVRLKPRFITLKLVYVPRDENLAGIYLEGLA